MSRRNNPPSNHWGTQEKVRSEFGISREKIWEWSEDGFVRSVKFGEGKRQGRRVFCLDDCAAALERLAVGLQPEVRRK